MSYKNQTPLTANNAEIGMIVMFKNTLAVIVGIETSSTTSLKHITFKWLQTGRGFTYRNYNNADSSSWTIYEKNTKPRSEQV
jgi:hypothetical protein